MATVRSHRLWGPIAVAPGATTTLYTVPLGFVAVVRSITIRNAGAAVTTPVLRLSPGGAGFVAFWSNAIAATSSQAGPYCVLEAGDVIDLNNTAAAGNIQCAGFGSLLTSP